ncbi:hypothetical protein EDC36_103223 [Tepidimonas ignava]|uniref:Bacteriophage-related protein n=1 Tax=Tepidimonas ignava TaxID=114249 RepID=A0A4R3LGF9_9BURK|nr:hypothetical protein [Tepidimonas ignava]TCS99159.1 hypothetical protein EDC36_103223 [Tepidimonas ignava]TSE22756.1 hypothetical protein Tigna_00731 [Tepidimonas ignava]
MSTKHRGRIEGAPVTQKLPTPAGGVKLETFVPWRLVQRGIRRAVIAPPGAPKGVEVHSTWAGPARTEAKDTALIRALGLAHHWQRLLTEGRVASAAEIAKAEGMDVSQVHRLMRLTLLAPELVERLAATPELPVERLLGRPWPYGWAEQIRVLASMP